MPDRNYDEYRRTQETTNEGMYLRIPASNIKHPVTVDAKINPFVSDGATQKYPLGTELFYGQRKFRYALNGTTALLTGKLVQETVPLAGHIDEVLSTAAIAANTINFTPAVLTTDDMTVDDFADGFLLINDDTGEGYLYEIKGHPAITGATAGTLTLKDPIVIATATAATTGTIIRNRYRKLIITPSTGPTACVAGWPQSAVPANEYFWLQTRGPLAALVNGTVIVGCHVMPSDAIAGAVEHWVPETDTTGEVESMGPLGMVRAVNADTEYGCIDARID